MPPRVRTGSLYDQGEPVKAGGVETWVVRAGPRGGTPIVFLHGIPTSAYLWREIMGALHEERDCVAFDWPGFGASSPPPGGDHTHRARADHLRALLDALGLRRVHLVAHDVGGPAGILFALENPERVDRLVVLNTTLYKRDYHPPLPALLQFVPVLREASRPFLLRRAVFDHFFRRGLARPDRLPAAALEAHWRLASGVGQREAVFATWAQFPDGAVSIEAIRAGMKTFPRPVLVLFGAQDPYLPPANAERLAQDFPDARLEMLPGAGHFLQEDAPEEVAERLDAFLRPDAG